MNNHICKHKYAEQSKEKKGIFDIDFNSSVENISKNKICPYVHLFNKYKLKLPIDSEGKCVFHSKDAVWKNKNDYIAIFRKLVEHLNNDQKIQKMDFEDFVFYSDQKHASAYENLGEPYISLPGVQEAINNKFGLESLKNEIDLGNIEYKKDVLFLNCKFKHKINFKNSLFNNEACFSGSISYDSVDFEDSIFKKLFNFDHVISKLGFVLFTKVKFKKDTSFVDSFFESGLVSFWKQHLKIL